MQGFDLNKYIRVVADLHYNANAIYKVENLTWMLKFQ